MTIKNLLKYIQQGENETIEFKSSFNKTVIETLVSFANTKGGKVIIGCSDKSEILGTSISDEALQRWLNEIKQKTAPALMPQVESIVVENKTIVVFNIPEYPIKPVAVQGRYYARNQNSTHLLTTDEIVTLRISSLNLSFDAFNVQTNFSELDSEAINQFYILVEKSGKYKPSKNIESDLAKLGFINNGELTRASELLFGKHGTAIHLGRFKSPTTIIDDLVIRSPLVFAVEEAMDFIKKIFPLNTSLPGSYSAVTAGNILFRQYGKCC